MGLQMWWTRLVQHLRPERPRADHHAAPPLTRTQQDIDREARLAAALSAEDRDWERATQERHRERQDRARRATMSQDH
jgi:hypothetical protein